MIAKLNQLHFVSLIHNFIIITDLSVQDCYAALHCSTTSACNWFYQFCIALLGFSNLNLHLREEVLATWVRWFCFPPSYPLTNSASAPYSPISHWPYSLSTKSIDYMALLTWVKNLQLSTIFMAIQDMVRCIWSTWLPSSHYCPDALSPAASILVPSTLLIFWHFICVLSSVLFYIFFSHSLDSILRMNVW